MTGLMTTSGALLRGSRWYGLAMLLFLAGCDKPDSPRVKTPKPAQKKPVPETRVADKQAAPKSTLPVPPAEEEQPATQAPRTEGTLTDLVNQAAAAEFRIPEINETKVAAAGVRKLSGRHITIYTDLPAAPEIDELPKVFDFALPQWSKYFELANTESADWKIVGYLMKDKELFAGLGLLPDNLPPFLHGYQRGSEIWWYDQPGTFYRRELMLHEGTHAFMMRFLGGMGPPWYAEGMAEYLGTHRWEAGQLTLAYNPRTKEEAPYWGRVKVIKDEYVANRGMLLTDIMRYDAHAHLKTEPYGWCWAAAMFLDNHPLTQKAFRKLPQRAGDRSVDFSRDLLKELEADWPVINEDWQLLIVNADYGYDVRRAAVMRKPEVVPLPAKGAAASVLADRGWQSSGFSVEAGKTYTLTASGRYQVGKSPRPWPCEPGGITIHYHRAKPLGMLLAAVGDIKLEADTITPLANPTAVGTSAEITPAFAGTLFLCINEGASGLADNEGTLKIEIKPKQSP
jgi:hypothetical protein